jgi:predicted nuclease with TOPRIM domain
MQAASGRLSDQRLVFEARQAADELEQALNEQIHAQARVLEELPRLDAQLEHYEDKINSIRSVCELHRELGLSGDIRVRKAWFNRGGGTGGYRASP